MVDLSGFRGWETACASILQAHGGDRRCAWCSKGYVLAAFRSVRSGFTAGPVPRGTARGGKGENEDDMNPGAYHWRQYSWQSHRSGRTNARSENALMVRWIVTPTPYVGVFAALVATTIIVAVFERLFGFPPLVLFAAPIALAVAVDGLSLVVIAVVAAALIGDFLFVAPVHQVTVHAQGLRLLAYFGLGAVIAAIAARHIKRA